AAERALRRSWTRLRLLQTERSSSPAEDFLFLRVRELVDFLDRVVGELLYLMLQTLALILADVVLLLVLFQMVHAVAADVADCYASLLGILADELRQLLAPLLGQFRDRQTDHLAVDDWVDAKAGVADGLLDGVDIRAVP